MPKSRKSRAAQEDKTIDQLVGARVRQGRREAGATLVALAKALKLSHQQVQKYETGANRIAAGTLFEIAGFLDMPIGYFFADLAKGRQDEPANEVLKMLTPSDRALFTAIRNLPDTKVKEAAIGFLKAAVDKR